MPDWMSPSLSSRPFGLRVDLARIDALDAERALLHDALFTNRTHPD